VRLSHDNALTTVLRLVRILRLFNLADQELKGDVDMFAVTGTGFRPAALELLRQLLALITCNLALFGPKIALVTNNDQRNPVRTLARGWLLQFRYRLSGVGQVPSDLVSFL
jgi:hypothetical protein